MIIQNYGLYWRAKNVFWGDGTKGKKAIGTLLGHATGAKSGDPINFRDQTGIYVLYDDEFRVVYVGQTGAQKLKRRRGRPSKKKKMPIKKLYDRLKQHQNDNLAGRW